MALQVARSLLEQLPFPSGSTRAAGSWRGLLLPKARRKHEPCRHLGTFLTFVHRLAVSGNLLGLQYRSSRSGRGPRELQASSSLRTTFVTTSVLVPASLLPPCSRPFALCCRTRLCLLARPVTEIRRTLLSGHDYVCHQRLTTPPSPVAKALTWSRSGHSCHPPRSTSQQVPPRRALTVQSRRATATL